MENTRFLKITIIVLLLVNIATLIFLWTSRRHHESFMQAHGPSGPGGPPANAFEFLVHELKLDEQQVRQLEGMRDKHHEAVHAIQEQTGPMHHRFFDLLKTNDSTRVMQLADSMAQTQKQIELLTFRHFRAVRDICRPEQQKRFDEVINEALRMMAPKPPHGPGGPHGPHPAHS